MGTVAPRRSVPEPDLRPSILRFTYPFNTLGWPAAAIPCGPAENGLPASVTLASTWDLDHDLDSQQGEALVSAIIAALRGQLLTVVAHRGTDGAECRKRRDAL